MSSARFLYAILWCENLATLPRQARDINLKTRKRTGNLSLRSAVLCCALLWRLDCAHTWGHGAGMMKMMELLCSSVGISVVEPTMAGPVVKPAPAKM